VQNSRRVARELALKVLFQVDVGKQPLEEVLVGAMGQLWTPLDSALNQVGQETLAALRKLAADQIERRGDKISAQSSRQIKTIATTIATEIRGLATRGAEIGRELCRYPAGGAAERAAGLFGESCLATREAVDRLAARESLYPELLRELADAAENKILQMEGIFAKQTPTMEQTAAFLLVLVEGTTEKHDEIDRRLAERSTGWTLDRQAAVDRNIMRMAAYEILYVSDIPAGASINEAVELAKKYSTAESGRFVNGVLGALSTSHE
jgi:N utilization substance protein B